MEIFWFQVELQESEEKVRVEKIAIEAEDEQVARKKVFEVITGMEIDEIQNADFLSKKFKIRKIAMLKTIDTEDKIIDFLTETGKDIRHLIEKKWDIAKMEQLRLEGAQGKIFEFLKETESDIINLLEKKWGIAKTQQFRLEDKLIWIQRFIVIVFCIAFLGTLGFSFYLINIGKFTSVSHFIFPILTGVLGLVSGYLAGLGKIDNRKNT